MSEPEDVKPKIVFVPGCFGEGEISDEEIEAITKAIQAALDSGEINPETGGGIGALTIDGFLDGDAEVIGMEVMSFEEIESLDPELAAALREQFDQIPAGPLDELPAVDASIIHGGNRTRH
jgi:hypothetical protein